MNLLRTVSAVALLTAVSTVAFAQGPKPVDERDQASYTLGQNIGASLKGDGLDGKILNPEFVVSGLLDALTDAKPALTEAEREKAMKAYQQKIITYIQEKRAAESKVAAAEGEQFLAANKTKEGVKTTASGLQYKVIKLGTGTKPLATDEVTVHYEGRLINGTVFDSSIKRGQPASFPLMGVIGGWTEGVQLMPAGSKFQFYIPYKLAYGERGSPPAIPPFATLVFDIELISVKAGSTLPKLK